MTLCDLHHTSDTQTGKCTKDKRTATVTVAPDRITAASVMEHTVVLIPHRTSLYFSVGNGSAHIPKSAPSRRGSLGPH